MACSGRAIAGLSCKARLCRRFVRAADAQRSVQLEMIISNEDLVMALKEQRKLCDRFSTLFDPADLGLNMGIAKNFSSGLLPLNGLRHPATDTTSGWYLWAGEAGEKLSEANDFFEPMHGYHLLKSNPVVLKYLALPPGWRFLATGDHEDVWFDATLLEV